MTKNKKFAEHRGGFDNLGRILKVTQQIIQRVNLGYFTVNSRLIAFKSLDNQRFDDIGFVSEMPINGAFGQVNFFGDFIKGCSGVTFIAKHIEGSH